MTALRLPACFDGLPTRPASYRAVWKYLARSKHPMGPVPTWGWYFYWGRGITRVVITAPFIRLTLMPVTQSSGNSYLYLERVSRVMASLLRKFLSSCGCSHNPFFLKEINFFLRYFFYYKTTIYSAFIYNYTTYCYLKYYFKKSFWI